LKKNKIILKRNGASVVVSWFHPFEVLLRRHYEKYEGRTYMNWFQPFEVLFRRDYGEYEGRTYGLDLDLRTTLTYHVYEYGRIFSIRILGFGFELSFLLL